MAWSLCSLFRNRNSDKWIFLSTTSVREICKLENGRNTAYQYRADEDKVHFVASTVSSNGASAGLCRPRLMIIVQSLHYTNHSLGFLYTLYVYNILWNNSHFQPKMGIGWVRYSNGLRIGPTYFME